MDEWSWKDPKVKVRNDLPEQIAWINRCHDAAVKKLKDEIKDLQLTNNELETENRRLERTNWKKKYEKLRQAVDDMRGQMRSAIYCGEDDDE